MKKTLLILFLFAYSIIFGQQSKMDSSMDLTPLVITSDTTDKYLLDKYVQYIADTASVYTIEQVSSPAFANKFIPYPLTEKGEINYNDTVLNKTKSKTFWLRFSIESNLSYDKEWYLYEDGYMGSVSLVYMPDANGKFTVKKSGTIPLKEREIKHGNNTFLSCVIFSSRKQTFYVKIMYLTRENGFVELGLINKANFFEKTISSRLINGIFLGVFLLMILYNLILYISIKEKSYLYYILYIFFFALMQYTISNYTFEFLWPNHPRIKNDILGIAVFFSLFMYVLFGKTYLNTKENLPKWNKAINIQLIACSIAGLTILMAIVHLIPSIWIDNGFFGFPVIILASSAFVILLIPAILCMRKGIKHARYFLVGNIMVTLGACLWFWGTINQIEILFKYGLLMGVVMEMILFSIGIGAKVNGLNKDKVKAQGETIAQLEENEKLKDKVNRELEQKVNERTAEVVKQKEIIEEKNKDITDSITYAKRIQQAKLPKKEEIFATLPNSFVLFKPKDIVSGDFYFFHKSKQSVFIAAADCTGHGVPGAFMSMIGSERLEDAVSNSNDTSQILQYYLLDALNLMRPFRLLVVYYIPNP